VEAQPRHPPQRPVSGTLPRTASSRESLRQRKDRRSPGALTRYDTRSRDLLERARSPSHECRTGDPSLTLGMTSELTLGMTVAGCVAVRIRLIVVPTVTVC